MALACKREGCKCSHTDCDNGYIFTTYVTKTENKARNGEKIVVETEYEGVLFCPQCDPQRAHIQSTSSSSEEMARRLACEEGIFAGISSGGGMAVALRIALEVENATIVSIVCDRGDRYLSTGVFPA